MSNIYVGKEPLHQFRMADSMMYQFRLSHGWTIKGRMKIFRDKYASVVYPNGNVLVIGGVNSLGTPITSVELYNAAEGGWEQVGDMQIPRYNHTATLLFDGRVLVTGGAAQYLSMTTELYEPIKKEWRLTALMSSMRCCAHTATLLLNGKVLVIGGIDDDGAVFDNHEIFDPIMESWSASENSNTGFSYHQATRLTDGRVLITGGLNKSKEINNSYIYDPVSNLWSSEIKMVNNVYCHAAIRLDNGKILVTGGYNAINNIVKTAQIFDSHSNQWHFLANMIKGRVAHLMRYLDDGSIIVIGGMMNSSMLDAVEEYDIYNDAWTLHDLNFFIS